jgi:hypothetical protein
MNNSFTSKNMYQNDETLPNFIKRKHPNKGREKRNKDQGSRTKVEGKQASSPSMHVPKALLSHGPPYEQEGTNDSSLIGDKYG